MILNWENVYIYIYKKNKQTSNQPTQLWWGNLMQQLLVRAVSKKVDTVRCNKMQIIWIL